MNGSRFVSIAFGITLVVLLSGIIPFTSLQSQVRPKMQIAFVSERDGNSEIYVMDENGKNLQNLTNHPLSDRNPDWSSDNQEIVFQSNRAAVDGHGQANIYVMNAGGKGIRQLTNIPDGAVQPVWSPDGSQIAFLADLDRKAEIYVMKADGTNVRQITDHPAANTYPAWSPDGRRIAFQSDRDRVVGLDDDIYVIDVNGKKYPKLD